MLTGSSILLTGGTGSFGNAFVPLTLGRWDPKRIVIFSRDEMKQWDMAERYADDPRVEFVIGDVRDRDRLASVMSGIDVVVHAAATKIVPTAEYNPFECVKTNINGAMNLIDACIDRGIKRVVALSTDKAVNPSSIMGASKLFAERYLQGKAAESNTRFVVVRFGNVLASSGSAVPIFESRLRDGREIVVTDPDVRRFFMTIDEAAQLVLVAAATGDGGGTYVLDMGEPIRIVDLVHSLAYVMEIPQSRVAIRYIGLRPGEKLDEELFFADERQEPTRHSLVLGATRSAASLEAMQRWRTDLERAVAEDANRAGELLMEFARLESGGAEGRTHEDGEPSEKEPGAGVAEEAVR